MAEENKIKVNDLPEDKKRANRRNRAARYQQRRKNAAVTAKAVAAAHAAANLLDKASRPSEKSYFSDGLFLSKHLQVNQ